MISWTDARMAVLAKAPSAGVLLDIIEKYWGDGKLTEDLAKRFIDAFMQGDYIGAKKLLYGTMLAADLINVDVQANAELKKWIDQEKKIYDFSQEIIAQALKVALGLALITVGL